jgi:hypothetical protein
MNDPAAEDAFSGHAHLFHDACGGGVLAVACYPHAKDLGLLQRPCGDRLERLTSIPFALVTTSDDITRLCLVSVNPQCEAADQRVARQADRPRELQPSLPPVHAAPEELLGVAKVPVRLSDDVASDFGIPGVGRKDRLSIGYRYRA